MRKILRSPLVGARSSPRSRKLRSRAQFFVDRLFICYQHIYIYSNILCIYIYYVCILCVYIMCIYYVYILCVYYVYILCAYIVYIYIICIYYVYIYILIYIYVYYIILYTIYRDFHFTGKMVICNSQFSLNISDKPMR
jgi:hypothetical protein